MGCLSPLPPPPKKKKMKIELFAERRTLIYIASRVELCQEIKANDYNFVTLNVIPVFELLQWPAKKIRGHNSWKFGRLVADAEFPHGIGAEIGTKPFSQKARDRGGGGGSSRRSRGSGEVGRGVYIIWCDNGRETGTAAARASGAANQVGYRS